MARFAPADLAHFPARTAAALASVKAKNPLDGSKTLAGMLLAAVFAALLVVADQLIETWADGHLLVGWVAVWTVVFAVLALLVPPLRQLSLLTANLMEQWSDAARQRRLEAQMWESACSDPRVMADLQHARMRSQAGN